MRSAGKMAAAKKKVPRLRVPKRLTAHDVRNLIEQIQPLLMMGSGGSSIVREQLEAIDRRCSFSTGARPIFQDLLGRFGIATRHPIVIPQDDRPFWFRFGYPLAGYRSKPRLPPTADVVVIGAGLTGASAAYHLADTVRERGWRIVVLDMGDPAGEASGRNGGNFELIPENSVGIYEGLASERLAFLRRQHPHLAAEILRAVSERQASLVLGLALRNRDLLKGIILREGIDCDFSPKGWLYLAGTEKEEQGICEELSLAAQHGQKLEIWSRSKIRTEFGFETDFLGRFIPGDGTYHPVKYVTGVLQSAFRKGVELYSRVRVREVDSQGEDRHRIETEEGSIVARRVVVATNAFTGQLFNEMKSIQPYQSQVMVTEDAPDRARGRICTSERGPVFFNQPRDGAENGRAPLLMGGGDDRPMKNPSSRRRSPRIHARLLAMRDQFFPELHGRPPSTEWVGPMGFTPDQLPCIGFLRPGVVISAGFNGYGGSYTTAAGLAAAEMAQTGIVPDWVPEDIFSPRRFLSRAPFFMSRGDGLWRIALSLCDQAKLVQGQISDALSLRSRSAAPRGLRLAPLRAGRSDGRTPCAVDPEALRSLAIFAGFARQEIRQLLPLMRGWECPAGTQLFAPGDPCSCFVAVRGSVDLTLSIRDEQHVLAQLDAGSIFGLLPLLTGEPHSAGCRVSADTVLVELMREPVKELLDSRSALATKLLGVLSQGLITAVRRADRRLLQITADEPEMAPAAEDRPRDQPRKRSPSVIRRKSVGRARQIGAGA
jgi:glycine/D-amino acid oxidase-like deaminating enzyme/CRP-like cAMP-binding protein